jgi:hypothetical protein
VIIGRLGAAVLVSALLFGCAFGCSAFSPPEAPKLPTNVTEAQAALQRTCDAALTVCSVYQAGPSALHNERDDQTCADVFKFCTPSK